MKTSSLFSLDLKDLAKGLLVAVGCAVISALQSCLQDGLKTLNWKNIGCIALAAGLSYLTKNFLTPARIISPAQ